MKTYWTKFREAVAFLIILTVIVSAVLFAIPAFLLMGLAAWVSPKGFTDVDKTLDAATVKIKAWGEKHGKAV